MNPLPGVGRADLLRLLECLGEDGLHHAAGLAGFGCAPEEPEARRRPRDAPRVPGSTSAPAPAAARERRLETPTAAVGGLPFYRVTRRHPVARTRPLGEVPDWYRHARHLPDLDLDPRDLAPPVPAPLTPWRRLWPFLHAALGRIREAQAPDIQRLVGLAARGRLPRRVPRLRRAGWAPQCRLILDLAPRLEPLRADIWGLIRPLVRLRGHLGMQLYAVTAGPEGPWHTPSHREGWCEVPQPAPPPPGTPVLCVGDLGCYGAVAERLAWRRFGEALRGAGCRPLALMPCPARYWDPGTAGLYRQVSWDRARRLPCRLSGWIAPPYAGPAGTADTEAAPDAGQDPGAERLLDLLAPAVRLEPALLRALRCRLPGMDIGVEMAAWLHPDLAPKELGGEWRGGGALERRFRGNRARPVDERLLAAGLMRAMHGYLLPSLRHREGTNLARLLGEDDGGAGDYLADTVLTLQQGYGDRAQRIRRYVLALAEQLPPEAWQDERLVALWASANRERLRERTATLPPGLDGLAAADWILAGSAEPAERVLVQRGAALFLEEQPPSDAPGPATGSPLARLMVTDAPVELSEAADAQGGTGTAMGLQTFPPRPDQAIPIRPAGLLLNAYDAELTIAPMTRPDWAQAIGQDAQGLFMDIAEGSGTRRLRWVPPGLGEARPGALALQFRGAFWDQADALRWSSGETPSAAWATRTGVDDFGLWAEFCVKHVTQRMRWTWPGEFRMGTPEDEPDRQSDEVRHRVILTRGYWLADTACTQALWQAVMGENPRGYKGRRERPVEQVTWDEVQQFVQRLGAQVPGLDPRLPNEAEWENACRAGTETPFSFGPMIGTDQVNYDGNHPYAGGEQGVYRQETVNVKALPANDWGLYQMHGNVWEWCQDWYGAYLGDPSIDPAGTEAGVRRVCRGGGWGSLAVDCRSGRRLQGHPGVRDVSQGFRLARGPSNRAAGPQPASQGQEAPGGRDAGQTKRSGVGQTLRAAWGKLRGK